VTQTPNFEKNTADERYIASRKIAISQRQIFRVWSNLVHKCIFRTRQPDDHI